MKPQILFLILLILLPAYLFPQISTSLPPSQKLSLLRQACEENLTKNILPWWSAKMPDEASGGFYGRVNFNNEVVPDAPKGGIQNARILWAFSAAYRVTKNPQYLQLATRAKDYILRYFIDKEYGGDYYSLNPKGEPLDTRKHTYTQAFFIYGLSEYFRVTGDRAALEAAKSIFEILENRVLDKEKNGYFEAFSRDWIRIHDRMIGEKTPSDEKSMNTSLHILEAYANLYRVWPDKRMEERLRNMVEIFLDKIIDKNTSHLILFFDRDWNGTSQIDSYGHDIESSWLLYEAAHLLKDRKLINKVREVSIKIADAAAEGLQPDGSMATEKDRATGHVTVNRSWWEQAETVVGYVNAYQLTGNEKYLDFAVKSWNYIDRYFVDRINGGWYSSVTPEGAPRGDRAGHWICPYHNGRMCLEVIERITR